MDDQGITTAGRDWLFPVVSDDTWHIPSHEYHPFYQTYLNYSQGLDPRQLLVAGEQAMMGWAASLPTDKRRYRYAEGKWSVREVLGHMIDSERLFAYRAFRIARGDRTPLAGFDQNPFVVAGDFDQRPWGHLLEEYGLVRASTLMMLETWDRSHYLEIGMANGVEISLRAQIAALAGHERHHLQILKERYYQG